MEQGKRQEGSSVPPAPRWRAGLRALASSPHFRGQDPGRLPGRDRDGGRRYRDMAGLSDAAPPTLENECLSGADPRTESRKEVPMRDDPPSFAGPDRLSTREEILWATRTSPEFYRADGVLLELRNTSGTLSEFSAEELEMLIRLGTSDEVSVN